MDSQNKEAAATTEATPLAEWERPEIRRIEAGMAEGARGAGAVDLVYAS